MYFGRFTSDALIGLRRTLDYTGHMKDADELVGQYKHVVDRHEAIAKGLNQLGLQFEAVFPLVVAPPTSKGSLNCRRSISLAT